MTSVQRSSVIGLLSEGECPPALYSALAKKWGVPDSHQEPGARSLRTKTDLLVGATADSGKPIISLLQALCSRNSPSFQIIAFLTVSAEGLVTMLHSLFSLPAGEFEEVPGDLCALVGELPPKGKPSFVRLSALTAAANEGFIGSCKEDFDAHVTSLSSLTREGC